MNETKEGGGPVIVAKKYNLLTRTCRSFDFYAMYIVVIGPLWLNVT